MNIEILELLKEAVKWDDCLIMQEYDEDLENPYIIDIETDSFFYDNKEDRDCDFNELRILVPLLRGNVTIYW